jgi:hypothetical protein
MQVLPTKYLDLVTTHETAIKNQFGDALYQRFVAGRYSLREFMELKRFLKTLI